MDSSTDCQKRQREQPRYAQLLKHCLLPSSDFSVDQPVVCRSTRRATPADLTCRSVEV
jgi:hypothetical protein